MGTNAGSNTTFRPKDLNPNEKPLSGPHKFSLGKYSSCDYCGHCLLKNRISQLVNRLGCGYANHPQYKQWVANGRKF